MVLIREGEILARWFKATKMRKLLIAWSSVQKLYVTMYRTSSANSRSLIEHRPFCAPKTPDLGYLAIRNVFVTLLRRLNGNMLVRKAELEHTDSSYRGGDQEQL